SSNIKWIDPVVVPRDAAIMSFLLTAATLITWLCKVEPGKILDIPQDYRQSEVDKWILKPAIKELSKERNLFDQVQVPFKNLAY
ncbi:hypothetical protein VWN94_10710, partial [Campylobacter coli]|nr:hypothetical protein [Campylobacter coli]